MAVKHKGKNWVFTVTRNLSFWHQHASAKGYIKGMRKFGLRLLSPLTSASVTLNGTESHIFYDQKELSNFADQIIKFARKKANIDRLEAKYRALAKKFLKSTEKINKKLTHENFKEFSDNYIDYCAGLILTLVLGRMLHERLIKRLQELKIEDIDGVVGAITYPEESTPLMESQKELINISILHQSGKVKTDSNGKHLQNWLDRFQHIPVNYCEEPWIMEDLRKMLAESMKEDALKVKKLREQNHKEKISRKKKLLREIRDKDVEAMSYAISKGTILNEFRKTVFSKVSLAYRPVFADLAKRGGSDNWRDCFYLTSDEMVALSAGKKLSVLELKQERRVVGNIVDENAVVTLLPKAALEKFLADLPQSLRSDKKNSTKVSLVTEVRGTVANRGKVTGVAKIVRSRKEFDKFNEGDILIATMTSVDFVPIMAKAAAFVTNEGGITSHASIVSREMNKPCIIGTKIATEVFKDGDLVEVDAEKGIVRIINK